MSCASTSAPHSLTASSCALVTGATGLTGREVIRQLAAKGVKIKAIARPESNLNGLEGLEIQWIRGEVYDQATVAEGVQGTDVIINLAACYRDGGATDAEYHSVHVKGTQLLAQAALEQSVPPVFIHASTMGVHGHIADPPGSEESAYAPGDIYQETKLEAELWLRDFAAKTRLQLAVVRPTAIIGPEDRRLLKLHKFAKLGWFPTLGGQDTLYHFVHVEDLARFLIHCAETPAAMGGVFLCGNNKYLGVSDIMKILGDVYDRHVRLFNLPAKPIFWLADVCEAVCQPLGISPPLYRRRVAFFTKDRAFDTGLSRELLGFQYNHTNESALQDTAAAYREKNWL